MATGAGAAGTTGAAGIARGRRSQEPWAGPTGSRLPGCSGRWARAPEFGALPMLALVGTPPPPAAPPQSTAHGGRGRQPGPAGHDLGRRSLRSHR